jgi:hypothetical protein
LLRLSAKEDSRAIGVSPFLKNDCKTGRKKVGGSVAKRDSNVNSQMEI